MRENKNILLKFTDLESELKMTFKLLKYNVDDDDDDNSDRDGGDDDDDDGDGDDDDDDDDEDLQNNSFADILQHNENKKEQ